jgi:phosphatidyl-myo-inositol alpha-mannosyltransferase
MRIVQVSPYDLQQHGGVQQHINSLAAALRDRGHDVLVIGPGRPATNDPFNVRIGGKKRVSFFGTSFELSFATRKELQDLAKRLADWRPDLVHYHTMWVPLLPGQIFRQTDVPSVATFHDTPPRGATGEVLRILFKAMSWFLLNRLDGAIAVSQAPLAHLRPGRRGCRPVILPPATDLGDFFKIEKTGSFRQDTVLFFGRLEPRKGINVLLDAWKLITSGAVSLPKGVTKPQLIIAGSGELAPRVMEASRQMDTQMVQHIAAPDRKQLLHLLSEATLVVSPALYGESFGIVLVEALASGTPVIAASNAGYAGLLTGKGEELLVPPGDAHALAQKISALLASKNDRRAYGIWGRDHARQFDVSAVIPQFEAVYQSAISRYFRSKPQASGSQA